MSSVMINAAYKCIYRVQDTKNYRFVVNIEFRTEMDRGLNVLPVLEVVDEGMLLIGLIKYWKTSH